MHECAAPEELYCILNSSSSPLEPRTSVCRLVPVRFPNSLALPSSLGLPRGRPSELGNQLTMYREYGAVPPMANESGKGYITCIYKFVGSRAMVMAIYSINLYYTHLFKSVNFKMNYLLYVLYYLYMLYCFVLCGSACMLICCRARHSQSRAPVRFSNNN